MLKSLAVAFAFAALLAGCVGSVSNVAFGASGTQQPAASSSSIDSASQSSSDAGSEASAFDDNLNLTQQDYEA